MIEGEGEGPHIASNNSSVPRKLKQGVVNMSSTLHNEAGKESNHTLWDSGEKVKANANTQVDAYHDKTSAKDRRKQRQDLEKSRKELAKLQQTEQNETKAGVSSMLIPTVKSKERDILLSNINVFLDNGTVPLDSVDFKFAYRQRYAVVGENWVGKSTMLNRIANWNDLEGFPRHLRVLHMRQELSTGSEETPCLQAVLEADVEVQILKEEEKKRFARLEKEEVTNKTHATNSIKEKQKVIKETKTDRKFDDDVERLKEVYERL